jgi:hypothetical protein
VDPEHELDPDELERGFHMAELAHMEHMPAAALIARLRMS